MNEKKDAAPWQEAASEKASSCEPHDSSGAADAGKPQENLPTDDVAARFDALFDGLRRSYGVYIIPAGAQADEKGKVHERKWARTVEETVTPETWRKHLNGAAGLGIVPIRDDGTCRFGAIDVDVYPLDLKKLAADISRLNLPLIPCRTKSGGAHVYAFFSEPVPAALVRGTLKQRAALLGFPGVEIFPKQDRLHGEDDHGSWINMPYHAGNRSTRYALNPDGAAYTMEEFLGAAEAIRLNAAALTDWRAPLPDEKAELFEGGPPCLKTRALMGFGDWQNNGMFNVSVYLRKRFGNGWESKAGEYNTRLMDPPLSDKDVRTIVKSVSKKNYAYMCKQEPIASVCQKEICLGCKYGIGRWTANPYEVHDGAICMIKEGDPVRLCNFTAEIVSDVKRDDGSEQVVRRFTVEGSMGRAEVSAEHFDAMNWVTGQWGARAIITPNTTYKMHLAAAIKTLSDAEERTVYAHTGWRKINGAWLYLHADGAIGKEGPVAGFEVDLGGEAAHYRLPSTIRDIKAAVRASLALMDVGPIGTALLAGVYRAPLGEFCDITTSVYLVGDSGTFKSAIMGAALTHWGTHWDGKTFPGNWSATANFLEKLTFTLKDAVTAIDDFAPQSTQNDTNKLHGVADRVLRAQGNRGGRGRMNPDGSLKQTYAPRGLIMASGEDVPKGYSLRARAVIVEVAKGAIKSEKLAELQRYGAQGLTAEAMAGFISYVAARADELKALLPKRLLEMRTEIVGAHARTGDNVASLLLGLEAFLAFASECGAIGADEEARRIKRAREELCELITLQDEEQRDEHPAQRFRMMIGAAVEAGRVHLVDRFGRAPSGRETLCGWKARPTNEGIEWQAHGDLIGYIDGDDVYLILDAAYAAAQRLSKDQERTLGLTTKTLGKRLNDAKLLKSWDKRSWTTKVRALGDRGRFLHVSTAAFLPHIPTEESEQPLPLEPEVAISPEDFERARPPVGEREPGE